MKDEETKEAVVVDDDRFLLVFLDGVLQERDRAYTINESSITLHKVQDKDKVLICFY